LNADHIKDRLHKAIHRAPKDVSRKEFEEITAVVVVIVAEVATEMSLVVSELALRVEALEAAAQKSG